LEKYYLKDFISSNQKNDGTFLKEFYGGEHIHAKKYNLFQNNNKYVSKSLDNLSDLTKNINFENKILKSSSCDKISLNVNEEIIDGFIKCDLVDFDWGTKLHNKISLLTTVSKNYEEIKKLLCELEFCCSCHKYPQCELKYNCNDIFKLLLYLDFHFVQSRDVYMK
jgi:hypothetical protein